MRWGTNGKPNKLARDHRGWKNWIDVNISDSPCRALAMHRNVLIVNCKLRVEWVIEISYCSRTSHHVSLISNDCIPVYPSGQPNSNAYLLPYPGLIRETDLSNLTGQTHTCDWFAQVVSAWPKLFQSDSDCFILTPTTATFFTEVRNKAKYNGHSKLDPSALLIIYEKIIRTPIRFSRRAHFVSVFSTEQ